MTDNLESRRATLEQRLADKREQADVERNRHVASDKAGMALAVKLSSEFIAGIVAGAALGWGIDQLAGTKPWGMIILLFLGFLAGVLNVMRATGAVSQSGAASKPEE
jgi:ATP synthase protein I